MPPRPKKQTRIFISHISEEAILADQLKNALIADFLGLVDIFVSSDTKSIAAGEEWLRSIEKALRSCAIMIVVCSPESIRRSWINFEAGAAWIRNISLIPVCHSGLLPEGLPPPLSLRQGLAINDADGLHRLYTRVADLLSCKVPTRDFEALARELTEGAVGVLGPAGKSARNSTNSEQDKRSRMTTALQDPRWPWRTLQSLAREAAVSESEAADLLRSDPSVRFGKGKSGEIIVGLRSRVGSTAY